MKIDLHRHMGGSIHPEFVTTLLQDQGRDVSLEDVTRQMKFSVNEPPGFNRFLRKFDILSEIQWTEDRVDNSIHQIVWNLAGENLNYAEIHFSVNKYLKDLNWSAEEAISFIHSVFKRECGKWDIDFGLVLSLKYESDRTQQRQFASIISNPKVVDLVSGINIVGDEAYFNTEFYAPIFREWKSANKGLVAHVGESQSAENVRSAIVNLGVNRVAHGIRAAEHPDIMDLANERGVCFDIALTSNLLTGVVPSLDQHPVLKMLEYGCDITIGTDDPVICSTTLDAEYTILCENFSISNDQLMGIMGNSMKYSFSDFVRSCQR